MALTRFKCTDFRCLESLDLEFGSESNLIFGANASGKTSILEAVGYLGRGRSFRGATTRELIRHQAEAFVIFGTVDTGSRSIPLGVRNSRDGLEVHVGGEKAASAAALAETLPLQVIDPEVHNLVAGSPEHRRRFVDWMAFHVEQGYLDCWRRFRRVLKQRNAGLRAGAPHRTMNGWDEQLVTFGTGLDAARRRMLDRIVPILEPLGDALLGSRIGLEYEQGWPQGRGLDAALAASAERDQALGSTQVGPHRADVRLIYDQRLARKLVSRGQQKLLACALIIAATGTVETHLDAPLLLLLDDPAAELDRGSVARLMVAVESLRSQVIATTLDRATPLFSTSPRLFHVEHGAVTRSA